MTKHRIAAACTEAFLLLAGVGLLVLALLADEAWFNRHVLSHVFVTRDHQVMWWLVERSLTALLGLVLIIWIRRWAGRQVQQRKGKDLAIQCAFSLLAILLSCVVSEYVLRHVSSSHVEPWAVREEPLRQADVHLGWKNVPSRTGVEIVGGQQIAYHVDAEGHRIAAPGGSVDHDRPSVLLAGESIMFGYRLNWANSIGGRLEAMTGTQIANLAVNAYSTDQMTMQLNAELPRFRRPVAVVALFMPTLLERNLLQDRPYLDAALHWRPADPQWQLERLIIKKIAPIHRAATIEQGIAKTRAALRAIVDSARASHAEPLILVPSFMPEPPVVRDLRLRILSDLPCLLVPLDPLWRIAKDGHPDARADLVMARAITDELNRRHPGLFTERPVH
jgi:hypothetical protein